MEKQEECDVCEICPKLTFSVSTTNLNDHVHRFGVFSVNFEHISHIILMFPMLCLIY